MVDVFVTNLYFCYVKGLLRSLINNFLSVQQFDKSLVGLCVDYTTSSSFVFGPLYLKTKLEVIGDVLASDLPI